MQSAECKMICGDCLEVMAGMEAASIDTIITDPPYGLEFMGKEWDTLGTGRTGNPFDPHGPSFRKGGSVPLPPTPSFGRKRMPKCKLCGKWRYNSSQASECQCEQPDFETDTWTYPRKMQGWHQQWAEACLRVAKPGAILLAFGGTRTCHRLTCAIEDAGWEIRDRLLWLYGSGFPKGQNIQKAIAKAAVRRSGGVMEEIDALMTAIECAQWAGWNTALKPAWESIVVAMKPLDGTFAENAERHGVAGFHVDGCRISASGPSPSVEKRKGKPLPPPSGNWPTWPDRTAWSEPHAGEDIGRWPANVVLDEEAADMLDEQSGELGGRGNVRGSIATSKGFIYGSGRGPRDCGNRFTSDSGGASRFFYTAKASRSEREAGLRGVLPCTTCGGLDTETHPDAHGRPVPCRRNHHPTVKPLSLIEWLCRLTATPTGGLVLDPFAGSGTTGVACVNVGRPFIGIEKEPEYVKIAEARIAHAAAQARLPLLEGKR